MYIKYFDFKILTSEYWVVCLTIAIVNVYDVTIHSKSDVTMAVPPMRKKVMSRVRVTYITLRTKYRNFVYSDRNTMCFFSETLSICFAHTTHLKKKTCLIFSVEILCIYMSLPFHSHATTDKKNLN